jgi:transcriptional regulator with XRE-family HTH domain
VLTGTGDLEARRHLEVSQRLRERRRLLGLTQKQVTSRLGRLGIVSTNKSLSSLEHGAGLDVARLPELAAALECTVTWLLGLTDDPHRWEPDSAVPSRSSPPAPGPADLSPASARTRQPARSNAHHTPEHPPGPWILGPLPPEP